MASEENPRQVGLDEGPIETENTCHHRADKGYCGSQEDPSDEDHSKQNKREVGYEECVSSNSQESSKMKINSQGLVPPMNASSTKPHDGKG